MTRTPVSVVIVSRQRPEELKLCLTAVARLAYPAYEVIVVADPVGLRAVESLAFSHQIKTVQFDEPNISAARNRGIAQAAGDIIAFLDDDAVPETRWLEHLAAAFSDPFVAAAGGLVLGRNGISIQWSGRVLDRSGQARTIPVKLSEPTVLTPPSGAAVKTEGTNMAIRRDVLMQLGGFDPAFRFYLDETDLNMRLALLGHATALVPLAAVHHGYAASANRRSDRAVRDLHEIAASTAVFLRKHCPESEHAKVLAAGFAEQRQRLVAQMVSGLLEPGDLRRILKSWKNGLEDGRRRVLTEACQLPPGQSDFLSFQSQTTHDCLVISGFSWQSAKLRAEAAVAARTGSSVSLFLMSPSTLYHRVRFHPNGYWEQTGGLCGRSDRSDRLFRLWSLRKRVTREVRRIGAVRFHEADKDLLSE